MGAGGLVRPHYSTRCERYTFENNDARNSSLRDSRSTFTVAAYNHINGQNCGDSSYLTVAGSQKASIEGG